MNIHTQFLKRLCVHSFSIHTVKIICCDGNSSGNTLDCGSTFYSHRKGPSLTGMEFLVEEMAELIWKMVQAAMVVPAMMIPA